MRIKVDRRYKDYALLRRRLRAAVRLIQQADIRDFEKQVLKLMNEIRCVAGIGSGIIVQIGRFYLHRNSIIEKSIGRLASDICHDAYHIYQYQQRIDGYQYAFKRGFLNGKNQAALERGAIRFQLKFAKRLGLSSREVARLREYLKKPYYYRIPQQKRTW